eukprot:CAMPEP_0115022244 /NCGR_PEP_ID=MMETSP0216-20121206/31417_1 /TAXON_ID=223996 /ORGANISM="Protocruzia adherens, Strain Boccale" /LENGTH=634 /DNA_ID=CAMNT_0002394855 /DNA_START=144 /DNA_END=2048 /DNA_ORIENTATION=-
MLDSATLCLYGGIALIVLGILWSIIKGDSSKSTTKGSKDDDKDKFDLHIYFGTQTGISEGFAKILSNEAKSLGFLKPLCVDLDEFEPDDFIEHKYVIMVVATYGEGGPTDNATTLHDWLQDSSYDDSSLFADTKFAVFGLGNRDYKNYNKMGVLTDEKMAVRGAQRFHTLGLGDDRGGIEDDFNEWKKDLWVGLQRQIESDHAITLEVDMSAVNAPSYPIKVEYVGAEEDLSGSPGEAYEFVTKNFIKASNVTASTISELKQDPNQGSTLHIELDISATKLRYKTADNLYLFPQNSADSVERLARRAGMDLGKTFILKKTNPEEKVKFPFPTPITVRSALAKFCDINGKLTKKTVKELAGLAKDKTEKDKLTYYTSAEGKGDFDKEIISKHESVLTLVEKYPSIDLNEKNIFSILPRIQPRAYTIASSNKVHPKSIHVAFSIEKEGLCSQYFKRYESDPSGVNIKGYVRSSTFAQPTKASTPMIMIGPGTGFAPFRAFLQDRRELIKAGESDLGDFVVYFGCRYSDKDYIYKEEIESAIKDGVITKYHPAFSRETDKKVYVQHKLMENKEEVWDLIHNKGAFVYVCGATAMGMEIRDTLKEIAREHLGGISDSAKNYLDDLEKKHQRFILELWG